MLHPATMHLFMIIHPLFVITSLIGRGGSRGRECTWQWEQVKAGGVAVVASPKCCSKYASWEIILKYSLQVFVWEYLTVFLGIIGKLITGYSVV